MSEPVTARKSAESAARVIAEVIDIALGDLNLRTSLAAAGARAALRRQAEA